MCSHGHRSRHHRGTARCVVHMTCGHFGNIHQSSWARHCNKRSYQCSAVYLSISNVLSLQQTVNSSEIFQMIRTLRLATISPARNRHKKKWNCASARGQLISLFLFAYLSGAIVPSLTGAISCAITKQQALGARLSTLTKWLIVLSSFTSRRFSSLMLTLAFHTAVVLQVPEDVALWTTLPQFFSGSP